MLTTCLRPLPGALPILLGACLFAACAGPRAALPTPAAVPEATPAQAPAPPAPAPLVTVQDSQDEGLDCFQITTPAATYHYHKQGAGFTSLVDADGNDWLGFHTDKGPKGNYRGLPNMGLKHFGHAGDAVDPGIVSRVESSSGDQVVISSVSADGAWKVQWTFHPDRAELQVQKTPTTYWFLYEGTPGGSFEKDTDYYVRSGDRGQRQSTTMEFSDEMADPEWIYFGDPGQKRALLLAKHDDDCWVDRYFPMDGMTVFGFGRAASGTDSYLRGAAKFSVVLMNTDDHATIAARARALVNGD